MVYRRAMPRPLIGVTLDAEKPGGYSKFPWYALRQNYLDAIDAAGGEIVDRAHRATFVLPGLRAQASEREGASTPAGASSVAAAWRP